MIFLLLTCKGISQIASDSSSTLIPNWQLKRAINVIENGKVVKQELLLSKDKIQLQDSLLALKDTSIHRYIIKDSIYTNSINAYRRAVKNFQQSISNSEMVYELQNKKLRREKNKKWLTFIAGIGGGYLIFHK